MNISALRRIPDHRLTTKQYKYPVPFSSLNYFFFLPSHIYSFIFPSTHHVAPTMDSFYLYITSIYHSHTSILDWSSFLLSTFRSTTLSTSHLIMTIATRLCILTVCILTFLTSLLSLGHFRLSSMHSTCSLSNGICTSPHG